MTTVGSVIQRKLGTFELILLIFLIWNNDPTAGATCDYLNKLRDAKQLEEGSIKLQNIPTQPVVDFPLCLIKPGFPCLGLQGKHADDLARTIESLALAEYLQNNGVGALAGTQERMSKFKSNKSKPRTSDPDPDDTDTDSTSLAQWNQIRDTFSRWSCTSAKCEFQGEEGICQEGNRGSEVWKLFVTEETMMSTMGQNQNTKKNEGNNTGNTKNGSCGHSSDSLLSWIYFIGFLFSFFCTKKQLA